MKKKKWSNTKMRRFAIRCGVMATVVGSFAFSVACFLVSSVAMTASLVLMYAGLMIAFVLKAMEVLKK